MRDLENQIEDFFNKDDQSRWELVKFGDVVQEVRDTIKNNREVPDFRIVGLEHLIPNDIHIRSWDAPGKKTTFTKRFTKGQVLFGRRRAYLRKAGLAEFDGICSGDIIVMEAKNHLNPSLLPFLVHSDRFYNWAVSTSAGSLSPRTKFKDLAKIKIRLPSLLIQEKLAELFWVIDTLEQSTMVSLNKIRAILDIEIRSLREPSCDTKTYPLRNLVQLHYGKPLKESDRLSGDFPVVGSSGICGSHDDFLVEGPGIVIGRKGSAGDVTWLNDSFWPIDTTYWVEKKTNQINDIRFLYYLLLSIDFKKIAISTAIPGLNRDDALNEVVHIPNVIKQAQTLDRLELINTTLNTICIALEKTKLLKTTLTDQIFSL